MSTAALAVGLAVTGGVAVLIASITILFCVLHKHNPNGSRTSRSMKSQTSRSPRKQVVVKSASKATEKIKKKAEKLKAEKMQESCCFLCACCRKKNGPPPDAPFGIEIKDLGESEVTVVWNISSTEDSSTAIEGFRIYVRLNENPDAWYKVANVKSDIKEYCMKGLNPSKRYVAGVSSKSRNGESSIIDTPTIILKRNPVQPGAPTEFDVREKTHNSITLSWKPPRKTGFSRIHSYHLMIKDFGENTDWNHLCTLPAFDRFMDFRAINLKSNNQYRFRVTAENIAGLGAYAETATIETLSEQPKPPGKPRGPIKYAKISHHSITLSWQPPEQNGGRPISGYAIEYKEKGQNKWNKAGVCEANINKFTVPRLQEDIEFVFCVIAMNDVGNSRPLIGSKVRTKLLEIPLSRRSSFRVPSRGTTSRESHSSGKQSMNMDELVLKRLQKHPSLASLENLDASLEADPHVPKSDFFTYDETEMKNISTKHNENRTRHSAASPLPLPSTPKVKKSNRRRRQHHDFSPLPVHSSVRTTNGYLYNSARKDHGGNEFGDHNGDDSFHGIMLAQHSNGNDGKHADGQSQTGNLNIEHNEQNKQELDTVSHIDELDDSSELRNKSNYTQHITPSNVSFSYSHKY